MDLNYVVCSNNINKIIFCVHQGTKLGWFIDPNDKSVMVFQPNQLTEVKYDTNVFPVLDVLRDWQVRVSASQTLLIGGL